MLSFKSFHTQFTQVMDVNTSAHSRLPRVTKALESDQVDRSGYSSCLVPCVALSKCPELLFISLFLISSVLVSS